MGTAPAPGSNPAMPDPQRLVRRSIAMLKRLGLDHDAAWKVVFQCIVQIANAQMGDDDWAIKWVQEAFDAAMSAARDLQPSTNDTRDNENADGRSSSTGGNESPA